jgi:hypothetical protein
MFCLVTASAIASVQVCPCTGLAHRGGAAGTLGKIQGDQSWKGQSLGTKSGSLSKPKTLNLIWFLFGSTLWLEI